jgi:type II secretory pathway pseudopilin PulG
MSTLVVILIVVAILAVLLFVGGLIAVRRRDRAQAGVYEEHVKAADSALEQARALDRGWHRDTMEQVARAALSEQRPDHRYEDLHLVLVDDQPGVEDDRAHFVAVGPGGEVRLVLTRDGDRWVAERIE